MKEFLALHEQLVVRRYLESLLKVGKRRAHLEANVVGVTKLRADLSNEVMVSGERGCVKGVKICLRSFSRVDLPLKVERVEHHGFHTTW